MENINELFKNKKRQILMKKGKTWKLETRRFYVIQDDILLYYKKINDVQFSVKNLINHFMQGKIDLRETKFKFTHYS